MQDPTIERVLSVWLGERDAAGMSPPAHAKRWFEKDPAFDRALRDELAPVWEAIMADQREAWLETREGLLAYVIVLDQLSRNMFRGDAKMFAGDARALTAAKTAVARGDDQALTGHARVFLYMPYMHSESLADQEACIALFTTFRDQAAGALRATLDNNIDFAIRHRDIIAKWGRFPHRNAVLGRPSTEAEKAFLEQPGSSF